MNNLYHWLKIRKDNSTIETKVEIQRPTQLLYIIWLTVETTSRKGRKYFGWKLNKFKNLHACSTIWCDVKKKLHDINKESRKLKSSMVKVFETKGQRS